MKDLNTIVKKMSSIVEQGMEKRTHRVAVTVTDPGHTMVTQRNVKIQRFARVKATNEHEAVHKARQHYSTRGYKVVDTNYLGEIQ